MAVLRKVAITWGIEQVRTWDWSSAKVTLRIEWELFSLIQWLRTRSRIEAASARARDRLVIPYSISPETSPVHRLALTRTTWKTCCWSGQVR